MKRIITLLGALFVVVALVTTTITLHQVSSEKQSLESDLMYRSSLLADGLKGNIEPNFNQLSADYLQNVVEQYSHRQRIAGIDILDSKGATLALSSSLPEELPGAKTLAQNAMDANKETGGLAFYNDSLSYIYATPLQQKDSVIGSLLVIQKADYVNVQLQDIWKRNLTLLFGQILLAALAALLFFRWIAYKPIHDFVTSLQAIRLNQGDFSSLAIERNPLLRPIVKEVTHLHQSLIQAQLSASEEARMSLEKLDSAWTAERLRQFTKDILKGRTIVTVSNREPYIHSKSGNTVNYHFPASGMATALESVMQATGGLWIATGSGDADRETVDKNDHIQVPPDNPKYTLRRIWLTKEEEEGYYYGFSNQALYPINHMAHIRPVFKTSDWNAYKEVNKKFAKAILAEIKDIKKPIIFIQDFHFTLLPKLIKEARPDATIGLFWHIPWVSAETFSICPWKKEIIEGMLGADLLGFHTRLHCNNFIETVSRELESLIDYEQFTITRSLHTSIIKAFPIGIAFTGGPDPYTTVTETEKDRADFLKKIGITSKYIGIGVDRLDYIKGMLERFKAIEAFLETYPEYQGDFAFIQIAPPSKNKIKKYQDFAKEVMDEVERINSRFRTKNWQPITFINKHHSHTELERYYKITDFCLITSLHDGMNLVSKEFIASRADNQGVLILSQFTGAAKNLKEALIINPYNTREAAEAIYKALNMRPGEQKKRMKALRNSVKNYNIYRWAAEFLRTISSIN